MMNDDDLNAVKFACHETKKAWHYFRLHTSLFSAKNNSFPLSFDDRRIYLMSIAYMFETIFIFRNMHSFMRTV